MQDNGSLCETRPTALCTSYASKPGSHGLEQHSLTKLCKQQKVGCLMSSLDLHFAKKMLLRMSPAVQSPDITMCNASRQGQGNAPVRRCCLCCLHTTIKTTKLCLAGSCRKMRLDCIQLCRSPHDLPCNQSQGRCCTHAPEKSFCRCCVHASFRTENLFWHDIGEHNICLQLCRLPHNVHCI